MPAAPYRPTVISIAAEYGVDAYAWDRSPGEAGGLDPSVLVDLGTDPALLARLSAWNDTYGQLALTDFQWRAEQSEADWVEQGQQLALELQRQLPGIEVYYGTPDPSRPSLRQQLGLPPLPATAKPATDERSPGLHAYAPLSGAVYRPSDPAAPAEE